MRKIVVSEYLTLDGVMEDPGGGDKSAHGGWSFAFWNEEAAKFKFDELFASDALLLGRVTYEGFAAAWPAMTDEGGFSDRMNSLPKFVVSTTLEEAKWNNSRLIKENVAEEIAGLKQEPGRDILVSGSGELVQTLMQHNLVDEYQLMVHLVVLGGGKRLFRNGTNKQTMKLTDTKTFSSGFVVLSYQPDPQPVARTGRLLTYPLAGDVSYFETSPLCFIIISFLPALNLDSRTLILLFLI